MFKIYLILSIEKPHPLCIHVYIMCIIKYFSYEVLVHFDENAVVVDFVRNYVFLVNKF